MNIAKTDETSLNKPLRVWPGVAILIVQWLAMFVVPAVLPEEAGIGVIAGLVGGVAMLVGWRRIRGRGLHRGI